MPERIAFCRLGFGFIPELGVSWLVCLLLALFLSACDSDEATTPKGELVVIVDSDLSIPKDVDHLLFEANTRDRALARQSTVIGAEGLRLPAVFHVPYPGSAQPVTVRAVASSKGAPRVQREAVTPVPKAYVGVLRLPLSYLCDGTANSDGSSTCPESETCIGGDCASSTVPESALRSEPWGGESGPGGPTPLECLDVLSCFDSSVTVRVSSDDCTVALPEGADPEHLNLGVRLPPNGAGICSFDRCWVVLDAGPEGWFIEGSDIHLPKAVCEAAAAGTAEVALTTACPQKVPRRPLCAPWSSEGPGAGEPGTGTEVPPVEGVGTACPGASLQACGNCGSQTRSCRNGRWSDWSPCLGEGECSPNATQDCGEGGHQTCEGSCTWGLCINASCEGRSAQVCGNCGTQTRECTNGAWSDWSECSDEGECAPGTEQSCAEGGARSCGGDCRFSACATTNCEGLPTQACGNCGTQRRECTNGTWSEWSACDDEGECAPDTSESCGTGGTRTCGGACQFGECVTPVEGCEGPSTRACGNCGTQSRTCESGTWTAWSECTGQGECSPNQSQACGASGQGVRSCSGACAWSACLNEPCPGPLTEACGNCGTRQRTCNNGVWSAWSACTNEGQCSPNSSEACGVGSSGEQVCGGSCRWGECLGQECPGQDTETCGNCGTRRRTCNNGVWSAWSACSAQGECSPNTTEACGVGNTGERVCGGDCRFGACTGQECSGPATEACGNCGSRSRTCNNGTWSAWSACTNQGTCAVGNTRGCANQGTQTCTNTCTWGACGNQVCPGPSSEACGNCGTRTRTCNNSNGQWSGWSACSGEGECNPRDPAQACGTGGSRTCSSACQWNACECARPSESQACGNCNTGTQTRTCTGGNWSTWSQCTDQACTPGSSQNCGTAGGRQTCSTSCEWGACSCSGAASEPCGNCNSGTRRRTCNNGTWSAWGACSGETGCSPEASEACGTAGGSRTCNAQCAWGTCSCAGPTSQSCGNCSSGTQERTCNNGTWSAWGDCMGQRCQPGTSQSCGTGGTQTCSQTCEWSTCNQCTGPSTRECYEVECGQQSRTCTNGQWSSWSACTPQGDKCLPGEVDARTCGKEQERYCTAVCKWSSCAPRSFETLVTGLKSVGLLAVDAQNLYFAHEGMISRLSLASRERTLMVRGQDSVTSLVVDPKYLYWTNAIGVVYRTPLDASGGSPQVLFQGPGSASGGLVVDSASYYWFSANNIVLGQPLDGKTPAGWRLALETGLLFDMVGEGDRLFWTNRGNLGADGGLLPKSGSIGFTNTRGTERGTVTSGLDQPSFLVNIGTALFFAATGSIHGVSASAGATPTVIVPRATPNGLVTDGSALFWTESTAGVASGRVMRASQKGADRTVLSALGQAQPAALAVDASYVYFALQNEILRAPKTLTGTSLVLGTLARVPTLVLGN